MGLTVFDRVWPLVVILCSTYVSAYSITLAVVGYVLAFLGHMGAMNARHVQADAIPCPPDEALELTVKKPVH
jgi:hypothetical protein